ncbi:acyl carrier protein [Gloeothece verrucosa]|uniref:Phosphopantetheine-binding protein n=1 Tax=Gloeothece verrucosa (strain PCC 7822) TaxID=497965 RepID=E0ULB2_GLOV7|nr:acyl carrier protein [Gloeothece verrucosa]ADN17742.1 phosphopantetheine-binding protein [Gloeothece verrucosa PCC 7822]
MSTQLETRGETKSSIQNWLVSWIAKELDLSENEINTSKSLLEYSLNSMTAMMLVGDLEDWLKIEIVPTLVWDYPSIDALTEYLSEQTGNSAEIETNNLSSEADSQKVSVNIDQLSEEQMNALLGQLLK